MILARHNPKGLFWVLMTMIASFALPAGLVYAFEDIGPWRWAIGFMGLLIGIPFAFTSFRVFYNVVARDGRALFVAGGKLIYQPAGGGFSLKPSDIEGVDFLDSYEFAEKTFRSAVRIRLEKHGVKIIDVEHYSVDPDWLIQKIEAFAKGTPR